MWISLRPHEGFLWKTEGILRREMTFQWFNQRPELDGKDRKPLTDNKHMEIWDASEFIMNYCGKKGDFCSWVPRLQAGLQPLEELLAAHRRHETPHGRWCMCAEPSWTQLLRRSQCIYPISPWTGGMKALCDTLSLYNFRPHFPQRPLNLTAIWWFAAITVHSWVKINLWDSSLGQGVWRHTWLCAGHDNLLWFIYLQMIPLI